MMLKRVFIAFGFLFSLTVGAGAATLVVQQDGSGDYTTIADALLGAQPGDTVLIGPGTYAESLEITQNVTLESQMGPENTILDGLNSFRMLFVNGQYQVTIRGLKLINAYSDNGSALLIWGHSTVLVEDCIFADNFAYESNAVHIRDQGTNVTIRQSRFQDNSCNLHSPAIGIGIGGYLLLESCEFIGNSGGAASGAINAFRAEMDVFNCLFLRNQSPGSGAMDYYEATGSARWNTFHDNSGTSRATVKIKGNVEFQYNIITGERSGYGLISTDGATHSCNLFYENARGSVFATGLGSEEYELDPMYCDYTNDVFTLCQYSFALAQNNLCGAMGAFGADCQVCGPVATVETTWGGVKALYH